MTKEERKARILEAVHLFLLEQGYPPSYRDIAEQMGVAHSLVHGLVKELRDAGLIHERPPQVSRSLSLTAAGRAVVQRNIVRAATASVVEASPD